jgi:serine protease
MSFGTRARKWSARGGAAAIALLTVTAGTQAAATAAEAGRAAQAGPASTGAPTGSSPVNPFAPAYRHPYRRGAVPTRGDAARMASWARQHPGALTSSPTHSHAASTSVQKASPNNVSYGGGNDGIGVTTGEERVYLVFFGSDWGTMGTNSKGDATFSNDPSGEAPYVQELFKGLGTGSEQWSGVMTQYCQGVAVGAQTCPSSAPHVAYPHGGALAGVWYDNGSASPAQATGHDLGAAAVAAATHFGNTTAAANRDAQYIILSPTGVDPDQYQEQGFCAWHDWNGDTTLSGGPVTSPDGDIAFTNMPYVTDLHDLCGENFVRGGSAGTLDGVSIVVGHEYAETITDQNPPGGWLDGVGEENADKCAWKTPGTTGGAAVLTLPTGAFAMQGTWANNANSGAGGCRFTQTIKRTQLLANPGFESGALNPWVATSGVLKKKSSSFPVHSGNWTVRLGGRTAPHTDTLAQTLTVAPANGTYGAATVSFWLEIKTNDPATKASDKLTVQVLGANGTVTLGTFSNLNAVSHYVQHSFTVSPSSFLNSSGQPVPITLKFTGTETVSGHTTSFLIDDAALYAS